MLHDIIQDVFIVLSFAFSYFLYYRYKRRCMKVMEKYFYIIDNRYIALFLLISNPSTTPFIINDFYLECNGQRFDPIQGNENSTPVPAMLPIQKVFPNFRFDTPYSSNVFNVLLTNGMQLYLSVGFDLGTAISQCKRGKLYMRTTQFRKKYGLVFRQALNHKPL